MHSCLKRAVALLVCLAMIFSVFSLTATAAPLAADVAGDVNRDGTTDIADATLVFRFANGRIRLTIIQLSIADLAASKFSSSGRT